MRINLFSSSGIFQNSVILDGFTMNDHLTLARNPDGTYEAATKRYVDSFPSLYDVSAIDGQIIPKELLVSSFGGALHGFNRTDVLLSPTGVTPGSYNSVTVNENGVVTSARNESFSGYTLHFANIIGRPTSVKDMVGNHEDYAVKEDGRVTVTGNLGLGQAPTQDNHLATYGYVTSKASNLAATVPVGSLKYLPSTHSLNKYLRANGGVLDKASYASLYAVVGDRYNGSSVPTDKFQLPDLTSNDDGIYSYYIKAL